MRGCGRRELVSLDEAQSDDRLEQSGQTDAVVGTADNFGQLGLGDTKPRERFTRLSALDGCGPVERVVCTRWATFVQCA